MKKRIIMYSGQKELLDMFSHGLEQGLLECGAEIMFYDLKKGNVDELSKFCEEKVDAVLTFNTTLYNMKIGEVNAWKCLNIPYITILLDHPRSYSDTLNLLEAKDKVFCIDRKHCEYIKRFFANIGYVGFLPLGGSKPEATIKPFSERKMDIMYAGNIALRSYDALNIPEDIIAKYSEFFNVESVIKDLLFLGRENPEYTHEDVLEAYLGQIFDNKINDDILKMLTIDICEIMHAYTLSYYRSEILAYAAKSGAQLYIYGGDYSEYPFSKYENVHLMGNVGPYEVTELMTDAKIVLSSMAWFKDGTHDRIFSGMLSGAVVLSEDSKYTSDVLNTNEDSDMQDIYVFSLYELDKIPSMITNILSNENESQRIIENAKEIAKAHTWTERAHELYRHM